MYWRFCNWMGLSRSSRGEAAPRNNRTNIAPAFVGKAVFNIPHTRALLDRLTIDVVLQRLCSWETVAQIPRTTPHSPALSRSSPAVNYPKG
jgi:hypothetical protein